MKSYLVKTVRCFLQVLTCALVPCLVNAQRSDDNAFAGKNAIFIYHGYEPASTEYPDSKGNTEFALQRREKIGNTAWVTVNTFHSPQNAGEVIENYKAAAKYFPKGDVGFDPVKAWGKWKKYRMFDSLTRDLGFPRAQMAFGLLVADSTVKPGNKYQYRILKNKQPIPATDNEVSNIVAFPTKLGMTKPRLFNRQTEMDAIILEWRAKDRMAEGKFEVYRAVGDEKEFHLISTGVYSKHRNDSVIYSMQDTKVAFSQMYRYYIVPVNQFGGGGNIVSDTIAATCMDPQHLLAPQYFKAIPNEKLRAIGLHYFLHDPGYIGSVHIMRSKSFDKEFNEVGITSARDTIYIDHKITPGKKYYYYLLMTDKMGRNSARSNKTFGLFQENDNLFPARDVTAKAAGKAIQITWQNPPDTGVISGYYVCRSEGMSNNFHRLTTLLPVQGDLNTYTDTSRLLIPGSMYAYSVISENLSNRVSKNSVIAYATAAGVNNLVKWLTPRNVKAVADNNHITLLWYDMRVVNQGLAYYNIYRKTNVDTTLKLLVKNYPARLQAFTDTTMVPGFTYTYAIECADDNGRKSATAITNPVAIAKKTILAALIQVFASKSGAVITWGQLSDKRIDKYFIYRYARGEKPVKIGEAKATDRKFEDNGISAGKTYFYYIEPDVTGKPYEAVASNKAYLVY